MKILEKFDGNIDVKESVDLEKEWKKLGEEMSSEEKRFLNLKIIKKIEEKGYFVECEFGERNTGLCRFKDIKIKINERKIFL